MNREKLLVKYPQLKEHHPYCMEDFINSRLSSDKKDWSCMCDFLEKYDSYLKMLTWIKEGK